MVLYLDFWYSNDGYIYQYDISSNNQSIINASLTVIGPYFDLFGALQLASNNKIYFDTQYGNFIGTINNPNILGVGCNVGGGVSATTVWGLPNFIDAYNVPPSLPTFIIIDTTTCLSSLQLNATSISSSYLWSNGTTTQSIFVSNSGTYWVQIQVLNGCLNVLQTDTFHVNISPLFNVNLGPNISFLSRRFL